MLPGAFTPIRWPLSCARVLILEFGMVKIVCAPCCMIDPSATTSIGWWFTAASLMYET